MENDFLKRIIGLIEENLANENFSVEELAEKAGLSRSMLHRRLIKSIGKSASDLITQKRLEHAKELLEKTDFTSAEIAYKSGFNSPSYFNKVFRKYYRISPGQLRKGEKLVPVNQITKVKKGNRKMTIPIIATSTVLLAALLFWAGFYFYNGKTDSTEKSIAILPFGNLSLNDDTQFFADGIVEDLLTRLSSLDNLRVTSRTSSEMFRNKADKSIPEIGKILGVGYILEGTVQRESDDIRISIQLIDAKSDDHLLSKQYDRKLNEFFEVQREIAGEIAAELSPVLSVQQLEKLKHDHTQNINALKLYQLGRYHSNKRTAEGYKKGIEYYEQALAEDPAYGLAYAGLADNYDLMSLQGHIDKDEGNTLALEMVGKALEIDSDLSEAHTVLGSIYTYTDRNWDAAEREFVKAIKLNPNYSTAHQYYAEYLTIMGRDEEARKHMDQALKLDPFSFVVRWRSSRIYYDQEQFDKALEDINVCLDLNMEHPWAINLEFDINLALKNDSAIMDNLRRTSGIFGMWSVEEADSVYQAGGTDEIKRWLTELNTFDPVYTKAIFYAMLGEYDNALEMLELAAKAGHVSPYSTASYEYKPLRSNPRFIKIRKEMGLPPLEP